MTEQLGPREVERAADIKALQGPILVLGASGFIGANLMRYLLAHRDDVYGTTTQNEPWRLDGIPARHIRVVDLLVDASLAALLESVNPKTVFDCVAYGAYSFESDSDLIYRTNVVLLEKLLRRLSSTQIVCYVHAGSSSEYGDLCAGPVETAPLHPNSHYSVSKIAAAKLVEYYGKKRELPCANLRLFSAYGPYEDSSRLLPAVIQNGVDGRLPPFVNPDVSRDFIYIDDVCEAFVSTARRLERGQWGESFNVGTGVKTTIRDVAQLAARIFEIQSPPEFSMQSRAWDITEWYASTERTASSLAWRAGTSFADGFSRMTAWYRALPNKERYQQSSKRFGLDVRYSVSAVIACYKDEKAIPIMYQRLKAVFEKLKIEHEIIFVNDGSPDQSEEAIRQISARDRRVVGISHSRNFGSQAAFRSGMELSRMNACVLLDGDLQDPPEVIEAFVEKWREGYEVVFGRRVKREATLLMQAAYKAFYRAFDFFSYLKIPKDAGDFSLIDRRVVTVILQFPERDLFLRGIRAFAGFRQTGVDYVRPERMFGRSTNSILRNVGWAKKGILSFSNVPLNMLSFVAAILLVATLAVGVITLAVRIFYPGHTPSGLTTVILVILFFGAANLFAIALVGEYIAKIFEETKQRPLFVRKSVVRDGEIRSAGDGIGVA